MQYDAFKEDIAILNIYFSEPTLLRMYQFNDINLSDKRVGKIWMSIDMLNYRIYVSIKCISGYTF